MSFYVGVKHDGGHVDLEFTGVSVSQKYPDEAPDVHFDEVKIAHDDLDRDLDPIAVFEEHDNECVDSLAKQYGNEWMARQADRAYDRARDQGLI